MIVRLTFIIVCLISFDKLNRESSIDDGAAPSFILPKAAGDSGKVNIDLEKSIVEWKGTKLMGVGSHTGTVKFIEGFLMFSDGEIAGGQFFVDMKSIYNTDIPLSDPIPRKNITEHLHSDFETNKFPTSKLKMSKVLYTNVDYNIEGLLTIKGITRKISFKASRESSKIYVTSFKINRFDWKIGENGTWLEKKLVDSDITLNITIVTK